jgi:hypothetical protein
MARELSRGRVAAVLAVCGMLVQVAGVPVTAASAARVVSATTGGPLLAGGAVSASALAASSGQPVEVLADRDWSQTFADPGGGFVHDFASPGYEQRAELADFYSWFRQAIEDFIDFE